MTTRRFRQLILAWWLLMFICGIVDLATEQYLPPELANYRASVADAEPTTTEWFVVGFSFIGVVVSSIGLYRFKRWGRTLFLLVHILSLPLTTLLGVFITSEWTSVALYFHAILSGGILFTMYLPPIANYFDEDPIVAESDKS